MSLSSSQYFAKIYLPLMDECNARVWDPSRPYWFLSRGWWAFRSNVKRLDDYVEGIITTRLRKREAKGYEDEDGLDSLLSSFGRAGVRIPVSEVRSALLAASLRLQ